MGSSKRHRLPAELLEPELGKVPLQSSAYNFASRTPGTSAHLVEDWRKIVVESDRYPVNFHVLHSNARGTAYKSRQPTVPTDAPKAEAIVNAVIAALKK
jgi:hypothetical protein